jgi:hypothetical protein
MYPVVEPAAMTEIVASQPDEVKDLIITLKKISHELFNLALY